MFLLAKLLQTECSGKKTARKNLFLIGWVLAIAKVPRNFAEGSITANRVQWQENGQQKLVFDWLEVCHCQGSA